jgi:membrane protein
MKYLNEIKTIIKLIFIDFERKHLSIVAAGLAYYFLMSLVPALVLLIAVVEYLSVQDAMERATSFVANVIPQPGVSLIEPLLDSAHVHRSGLLSFGIITTLWLSSIGVKAIIAGLDIVYEVRVPRRLWTNRILAFGLTIGVGVLLLLGVALTVVGPTLEALLSTVVPVQSLWVTLWPYVQWSFSAIFTFSAIELLYLFAPNVSAADRLTIPGAVLAALVWLALAWSLGFYFHHFLEWKLDRFYGILATPVALMIWLYWGACAILIGAQLNMQIQRHKKHGVPVPDQALQHSADDS